MKKVITLLLFLVSTNLLISQNQINKSDLIGCWKHYSEENKFFKNLIVYRPCNYKSVFEKKNMV